MIVKYSGYVPPEYARRGIYSTKSDVYSFGVLLLQIISGKRVSNLFGENGSLSLLEYVSLLLFNYKNWFNFLSYDLAIRVLINNQLMDHH